MKLSGLEGRDEAAIDRKARSLANFETGADPGPITLESRFISSTQFRYLKILLHLMWRIMSTRLRLLNTN